MDGITFVTGNKNKLAEVNQILGPAVRLRSQELDRKFALYPGSIATATAAVHASRGREASSLTAMRVPEVQGTIAEVATAKCAAAARQLAEGGVAGAVLTEDTSLTFHAFRPSASSRGGGGGGGEGSEADAEAEQVSELPGPYIKWFLRDLGLSGLVRLLAGYDDKSAAAVCTFALCEGPGSPVRLFRGECAGRIVEPRGSTAFGWDAVFESTELGKTFGEASKQEKHAVSHRGRALQKLRAYLESRQPQT